MYVFVFCYDIENFYRDGFYKCFLLIFIKIFFPPSTDPNSFGPRTVSANTVPSCDPSDLGHLLPQEVEMPHGFGAVRAVACGSQHSVLLTTHGSLYTWGRNMSGQLG